MKMKMKMFQSRIEKDFEFFVRALPALEPVEFAGLAKLLSVPTVRQTDLEIKKEDVEKMSDDEIQVMIESSLRPMDEILEQMMDRYLELSKRRRKEINQILKEIKKSKQKEVTENGALA